MKNENEYDNNIFEEEFDKISENKSNIVLTEVLKISLLDDKNEFKINLAHIRKILLNIF
jgi:hypothetical protein